MESLKASDAKARPTLRFVDSRRVSALMVSPVKGHGRLGDG